VGTRISVGSGLTPLGIAITPNGTKAYTANFGGESSFSAGTGSTVTPINLRTRTAGPPITVGGGPWSIAVTPDSKTAYVGNANDFTVTPVNVATNTAGAAIAGVPRPRSIAIARTVGPPAPPVLAKTATAQSAGGLVLVRRRGSAVFVPLVGNESIPLGSTVDATNGNVRVTTATLRRGGTQSSLFYGGQFLLTQVRSGFTKLTLNARLDCAGVHGRRARVARRRPRRTRHLWGNGQGVFGTSGLYGSAAVQGTEWLTEDTCTGTRVTVARGVVKVTDFVRHRTVLVRAPHSYLAGH
jgi:hypothetical protein